MTRTIALDPDQGCVKADDLKGELVMASTTATFSAPSSSEATARGAAG